MTREGKPNCCIYTDTAAVDYTIHLTGDFCQFHNLQVQNGDTGGSATGDNLSAVGIAGYGNYFKSVMMRGINSAAQIADAECSSLEFGDGSGESLFDDCIIGQNGYGGTRTSTSQGHLNWKNTDTAPSSEGGTFNRCKFLSRAATAGVPMVIQTKQNSIDKVWLFDNCVFSNYWVNWADQCNYVFHHLIGGGPATVQVLLKDCIARGYDAWVVAGEASGNWIHTNQPASNGAGGLTVEANA